MTGRKENGGLKFNVKPYWDRMAELGLSEVAYTDKEEFEKLSNNYYSLIDIGVITGKDEEKDGRAIRTHAFNFGPKGPDKHECRMMNQMVFRHERPWMYRLVQCLKGAGTILTTVGVVEVLHGIFGGSTGEAVGGANSSGSNEAVSNDISNDSSTDV